MDLSGNKVGTAGKDLAITIKQWGLNPPLQYLYLANCSIPEWHCSTILQSLHLCIHLTDLNMTGNNIGAAGNILAECINQWGCNPALQYLFLGKCSITEKVCGEIMKSLGLCKNLKTINLSHNNTVGESAYQLARSIRQWGNNPPLQKLGLVNCSIPEDACYELISALFSCTHLTNLQLAGNHLCENGLHLKRFLETITDTLEVLSLGGCFIPVDVVAQILSLLSQCKKLWHLSVPGKVTGTFSNFLPNPPLKFLGLIDTELNEDDLNHLTSLVESQKLPNLEKLMLYGNSLDRMEDKLEELLEACIKHCDKELKIFLCDNNLPEGFMDKWNSRCKDTKIMLDFKTNLDEYNDNVWKRLC